MQYGIIWRNERRAARSEESAEDGLRRLIENRLRALQFWLSIDAPNTKEEIDCVAFLQEDLRKNLERSLAERGIEEEFRRVIKKALKFLPEGDSLRLENLPNLYLLLGIVQPPVRFISRREAAYRLVFR